MIAPAPRSCAVQLSSSPQPQSLAEDPSLKAVASSLDPVLAHPVGSGLPKTHAKVSCFSLPVWTPLQNLLILCLIILPFGDGLQRSSDECPICLLSMTEENAQQWPTCGHKFHSVCIQEWRQTRASTCPICRAEHSTAPSRAEDSTAPSSRATNQVSLFHYLLAIYDMASFDHVIMLDSIRICIVVSTANIQPPIFQAPTQLSVLAVGHLVQFGIINVDRYFRKLTPR